MNKKTNRQAGFTLVEILVALTISLVLMAGVTRIFMGNRESYRVQSGMATLQENGRVAMDIMRRELMLAGYRDLLPFDLAQTSNGSLGGSDAVAIQYTPTVDCSGATATGSNSVHIYAVNAANQLTCTSPGVAAVVLVDGIENMQILYGVDAPGSGDGYADSYVPASGTLENENVVSARIAFLVSSVQPVARDNDGNAYALLDAPRISPPNTLLQLRRRVFFGTVILRNRFGR